MKKNFRIVLLFIVFIFISTFNPNKFNLILEKKNTYFEIENIIIVNNSLIKTNEIKKKLDEIYNKNIFLIKKSDVEEPLKEINFLKKIEVKKKYPNTVIIKIFETRPVAILIKDKVKYFLDSSSNLVIFQKNENFDELPTVFGKGSENYFINFLNKLKDNNFPDKKIKNYYYFKIGRWDLKLLNNKVIKLPDKNIDIAIKKSVELLERRDFENYKIIDLRVDGKIIVE